MENTGSTTVDIGLAGPLTTTFTPQAFCGDLTISSIYDVYTFTNAPGATGVTTWGADYDYAVMYDYGVDTACNPPITGGPIPTAYWSPGICPSAWASSNVQVNSAETTVNCCPPKFTYSNYWCMSTFTANASRFAVPYLNGERMDETATKTLVTAQPIYAGPIQVRYRDVDSSLFGTGSPAIPAIPSIPPIPTPPSPPTVPAGAGLSTGAKIGIGIGVPLGVIALGILAFLLWHRRRRAAALAKTTAVDPTPYGSRQELGGVPRSELTGSDARGELVGSDVRGELVGSDGRRELPGSNPPHYVGAAAAAAGHYAPNKGASEIYTPKQELSSELGAGSPPVANVLRAQYQPVPQQPMHEADAEEVVGFRGGPLQSPAELYPDHGEAVRKA